MGITADIITELGLPFTENEIKVDVARVNEIFKSSLMGGEKANSIKTTHIPTGKEAHYIGQYPQKTLLRSALIDLSTQLKKI